MIFIQERTRSVASINTTMDSRCAGESSPQLDRAGLEADMRQLPASPSSSPSPSTSHGKIDEEYPVTASECKKKQRATLNKKSIATSWGNFRLPPDALVSSDDHPPIFKRRAEFKGEACVGQKLTITAKPLPGVQIKVPSSSSPFTTLTHRPGFRPPFQLVQDPWRGKSFIYPPSS